MILFSLSREPQAVYEQWVYKTLFWLPTGVTALMFRIAISCTKQLVVGTSWWWHFTAKLKLWGKFIKIYYFMHKNTMVTMLQTIALKDFNVSFTINCSIKYFELKRCLLCKLIQMLYLFNPSRILLLSIPEALETQLPHMVWSWNLYQRCSLTKEVDWWRHHFCHVTHVYFTDQNAFLLTSAEFEKWRHQSTSFVKGTYLWKFQVDMTSWSQDIVWSLFFPLNFGL